MLCEKCGNKLEQNRGRINSCLRITVIVVIICVPFINFFILFEKIEILESRIMATIINETDIIVSNSELIENSTIVKENSTIPNNKNYFKIINRTEWGAADSTGELKPLNGPIGTVIIAHTETHECENFDACKIQMNILQLCFTQLMGFGDIGYNFLIGGDGAVYEGIGWNYTGHHTRGHNNKSISIGFIGNYQNKTPTTVQLSTAKWLLKNGLENNYLEQNYVIKGQKDLLPIVSPGENVYKHIKNGLENNYLEQNYVIKGQKDLLPIVSPGENIYNRINTWEHFFKNICSF